MDLHTRADAAQIHLAVATMAYFMSLLRRNVLTSDSAEWFRIDRETRFGMSEAQWGATKGIDAAWEKLVS